MKFNSKPLSISLLLALSIVLLSCDPETPAPENEEEIITDITLTFTPTGGTPIVVSASDPDGEGPLGIIISNPIQLSANTEYSLSLTLDNSVAGESITEEIEEEADEHMFFFGWTLDLFSSPSGDGNIDNRADNVNYDDSDSMQYPVGLLTSWTTSDIGTGEFRIVLKHQPGSKSSTSTVDDGETDLDLTWDLSIQ